MVYNGRKLGDGYELTNSSIWIIRLFGHGIVAMVGNRWKTPSTPWLYEFKSSSHQLFSDKRTELLGKFCELNKKYELKKTSEP
jgi:hypothetical protein